MEILNLHHYIQYLDLSHNKLTNLEPLGQLPFLMYLDVSKNLLTDVLNFKAPFYLTFVNYASNRVTEIRDLSDFWSLVYLDLTNNSIRKISGLENLKYLRGLNLANNLIECLENLNGMKLQVLQLQRNNISKFETGEKVGLKTLNRLVSIDLSGNRLNTLKLFRDADNLQEINMTDNNIHCLLELNYFRSLQKLSKLDLKRNPISAKEDYYRVRRSTKKAR